MSHTVSRAAAPFQATDLFAVLGDPTRVSVIAGPCSVESREQLDEAAAAVKDAGAVALRAGAFKPRTDPRSFQGLGRRGLELLRDASRKYDLPIVTEVL